MSFPFPLSSSPVVGAFRNIQWDLLKKVDLSQEETSNLKTAEEHPLDFIMADHERASSYIRILLKIIDKSVGISGPSLKVSKVKEDLSQTDALQLLKDDPTGVVTHYAIERLYETVTYMRGDVDKSEVNILTIFYKQTDGSLVDDLRQLLRVLHMGGQGDAFAQRGAAASLACILVEGCSTQKSVRIPVSSVAHSSSFAVEEPLQALVSWVISQLQSSSAASLLLVTPTLMTLMISVQARTIFARKGGIGYLCKHLAVKPKNVPSIRGKEPGVVTAQQLYELCFCLWTMTYECNKSEEIRMQFALASAVKILVDLVSSAPREKVVRVALSALRNLATTVSDQGDQKKHDGPFFLNEMIICGLISSVDFMKDRQWTDPDIVNGKTFGPCWSNLYFGSFLFCF